MLYYIFIFLIILLIIVFIYKANHIELYRYWSLKSTSDIKYYDNRYKNIPKVDSKRRVVISLTTIPSRINKLKPTLASLLHSSKRVDEITINIPYKTIKGDKYTIPKWLKKISNVKIYRVDKDYGPATKLLPTLKRENDKTLIIVVDDDVIYGSRMVEKYISTYYEKRCALTIFGAFCAKKLTIKSESTPTYLRERRAQYVDFVMGHNSYLVTGEMFDINIYNFDLGPKECRWVDDIWISGWLNYNGVKIWSLGNCSKIIPITNFENINCSTSLCFNQNATSDNNDTAIRWFHDKLNVKFLCHKK